MSKARKGQRHTLGHHHTAESRVKMSRISRLRQSSDEVRQKMSEALAAFYSTPEGAEKRAKMGAITKQAWQNQEQRDNRVRAVLLALRVHPNKAESKLLTLLNKVNPNEWAFVGDGQLIVGGKNPDCWNGDHKLAELWGDYWHRGQNPEERMALFRQYGYDTLVVWERELKTPRRLLARIIDFCRKSS